MNRQAKINMIFGTRGSGKTTKARHLTQAQTRLLLCDTLGRDYTDGVLCDSLSQLKAFWRRTYRGRFRIIYRPADPEAEFPELCKLVLAAGDMCFVVEETDLYFRQGVTCPEFRHLIQRGRHAGVEMICITQRPKGFGRLLTSQTEHFYLFATREPDDLAYFRSRCGDLIADKLQTLAKYECIEYDDYGQAADEQPAGPDESTAPLDPHAD